VNGRSFTIGVASVLILVCAKAALADGAYQRTEDRKKTLVWNNDPQPGDSATWSGDRDPDGYATGPGTLKWSRIDRVLLTGSNLPLGRKRTPISAYTGTMEHGKFSGAVTTVDHGKVYHATFADGHRKGRWVAGPVITKAESAEPTEKAEELERAEPEKSRTAATTEPASAAKSAAEKTPAQVAKETEDIPAQGPEEENTEPPTSNAQPAIKTEAAKEAEATQQAFPPLIAQASEAEESTTPRQSVTKKAALAPGAVRPMERPGGNVAKKSETAREKPEKTEKPAAKIEKPASSQPPQREAPLREDIPAEGPPVTKEENAQRSIDAAPRSVTPKPAISEFAQPSAKETPVDDSIRELTGPPTSLRGNPPPETNPPAQISMPPTAAASSPQAQSPKLTAVNAMDIADIEARTKGFDLGEYQLPKAEYNSSNDTWSVTYAPRDAEKPAKPLSVTIQDKNGKAEIKK
jgi:hypothetical protein